MPTSVPNHGTAYSPDKFMFRQAQAGTYQREAPARSSMSLGAYVLPPYSIRMTVIARGHPQLRVLV